MKKWIFTFLIIVIGSTLIAAAPIRFNVPQDAKKLCKDQASGKLIPCPYVIYNHGRYKIKIPGQGEPTMEKVTYFTYLASSPKLWNLFWNLNGDIQSFHFFNSGCLKWYWMIGTWKMPVGCRFRYQY